MGRKARRALGCRKRREGTRTSPGRPGAAGRGPPGLISSSAGAAHPKLRTGRAPRQPASMQLRRPAAFRSRPGDTRPAARQPRGTAATATAARPPGGGGVRGARGTPGGFRTRALEPAPLAGGARHASSAPPRSALQVPRVLDGRVGEYPSSTGRGDRPPAARAVTAECARPCWGSAGRERCAPGAETARNSSRLEGPVERRVRGKRTCSFWHLQGRKEFSQGSSHTWETGTWETEEQALRQASLSGWLL